MTDSYHRLLCRYAGYLLRAGHVEAASIALRTRSESIRDVIAYVATHNRFSAEQLEAFLVDGYVPAEGRYRYKWLATLGRVTALQSFQTEKETKRYRDMQIGLACLRIANPRLPKDNQHKQFHRLEAELLMTQGYPNEAAKVIESNEPLVNQYYGYLLSDLDNPTISGTTETFERWIRGFNRPFVENELAPIELANRLTGYNALGTAPVRAIYDEPKVTVVMTSYKPDPEALLLAVKSVIRQSWTNIELILVDDASPHEYDALLEEVRNLDSRIKLIKLNENGGTYRARNIGFSAASGALITGQDSDDWSHPQRIEQQVSYLKEEPSATGVVVEAIRVDDDLVRTSIGRLPERACEVSLMIRRELALEVGGYVEARKAADSEFRLRLEHCKGRKVHVIRKPLYLTRIGHESLSRADFKPGWSHPVRRAFWNACRYWHDTTAGDELRLARAGAQPIPIPNRFKIFPPKEIPDIDVVYVGDWRTYSGHQRWLIDAIQAHYDHGYHVGIMHLESLLSPSKETTRLSVEIQALINNRIVSEVIPDDRTRAKIAIIADAQILQFSPTSGIQLKADYTLVTPDFPPYAGAERSVIYRPRDCNQVAREIFSGEVFWTSTDPLIHRCLQDFSGEIALLPSTLPIVFSAEKWRNSRPRLSGDLPIIGRHTENYSEMWPKTPRINRQVMPSDGSADVRVLGDAKPCLRKFGKRDYPGNWLVFRDRDILPEAFMSSIDFFIYYPEEHFQQGFTREALEATAAGALAILPPRFTGVHKDTAIYAEPHEVREIVKNLTSNKSHYNELVGDKQKGLDEVVSNDDYISFVQKIVEQDHPSKV